VFDTLIESKRKTDKKRLLGVGFVSVAIHTVLIGAAIIATVKAGQSDTKVHADTAMVFLEQQQQQKPPEQQPVQLDVPLKGFQTVIAPTEIPTNIPPINLTEHFNVKDYSGSGVEGGVADGVVPTGEVFSESLVEEKPSVLSAPQPPYPELLKQAGIQGRVLIQAIIDTSGRAEPSSVRILQSPNAAFDAGSRNWVLHAQFRPARVHGRAVRVLIQVPLDYRITGR
jgi:periplasmic protein TonB